MEFFHHTDLCRLIFIMSDGQIRAPSVQVESLPENIVWATTDPNGDFASISSSKFVRKEIRDGNSMLVRISVASDNFEPWKTCLSRNTDWTDEKIEKFEFKSALQEIMKIAQEANRYFDYEEPWVTRKTNPLICERTMYVCMKIVTSFAILIEPFLPFTAEKIKKMINLYHRVGMISAPPMLHLPLVMLIFYIKRWTIM